MPQPTIERVDVAIVFALDLEAAPLRDRLEDAVRLQARDTAVTTGRLGDRTVAIAVAGMGKVAARATRQVIDGHRPAAVIAAGLCGGLSARCPRSRSPAARGRLLPAPLRLGSQPPRASAGLESPTASSCRLQKGPRTPRRRLPCRQREGEAAG
jgi:hypothetical protein